MKILSFVFATAFFTPLLLVKAQTVPAEVEALFSDIKENLNASRHLRQAHRELITSSKVDTSAFWPDAWSSLYSLAPGLIPQLADDEMVNFIAARADFALVCRAEAYSGINVKIRVPFSRRLESSVCEQGIPDFIWGMTIETREEFDDAQRFLTKHNASLRQVAEALADRSYWTRLSPRRNVDPVGADSATPEEQRTLNELATFFNQDEVYVFFFVNVQGVIGFKNGQAKLLMMVPIS